MSTTDKIKIQSMVKQPVEGFYRVMFSDEGECDYSVQSPRCRLDKNIDKILLRQERDNIKGTVHIVNDTDGYPHRIQFLGVVVRSACCLITARNITNDTVMNFIYNFDRPSESLTIEMGNFVSDNGVMSVGMYRSILQKCINQIAATEEK